ncbi:phenylacetic acid degradation protein [Oceanisphaera litoralis]|uniref:phenylacetic acid degradation protein PaaY n=1 Tax=Oceanisphaera litoralis TaxID=225144 RepID=UPI0019596D35|nr:phenylacetic acid degradation protein PaaY [Oceanisphaera litoralis]MBM7454192.1 phenylacetic acid degradation protein [Oceanisphaera litoralis]
MHCYEIDGIRPVVEEGAYVHPTAVLIGDVIVEHGVYIGPLASLRGDFGRIHVMENANVQDNCVMHGFPDADTLVQPWGHVGHGAILHGCVVEANALVGMNAVVMDGARVGEYSFVAAHSFVKAEMQIPARVLVAGTPARVLRELREDEIEWKRQGTQTYIDLVGRCLHSLHPVTPLTAVEPHRPRLFEHADYLPKYKA